MRRAPAVCLAHAAVSMLKRVRAIGARRIAVCEIETFRIFPDSQEKPRNNLGRAIYGWLMDNLTLSILFYAGGIIFANFVSAAKFVLLALVVALLYLLMAPSQHWVGALCGFVCIQLGYVSGIGIKTAWTHFLPKIILPSHYERNSRQKETKIE